MATLKEPLTINSIEVGVDLSQDNCASSTISVFTDVERLHLIESWELESASLWCLVLEQLQAHGAPILWPFIWSLR